MAKKATQPGPGAVVAGLIRKSDVQFPPDCTSPEDRAAYEDRLVRVRMGELNQDAGRDGLAIEKWYIDLDVPGRKEFLHKRRGLLELQEDTKKGLVRVLYARELSRIFRNTELSIAFYSDMEARGVDVRARDMIMAAGDVATSNFLRTIQFAKDQLLAEMTGQQIRSTNFQIFQADKWPGVSRSFWGLRYDPASHRFEHDPLTASHLQRVVAMFVEERGNAYRVALRLNALLRAGDPDALPSLAGTDWKAKTVIGLMSLRLYRRVGAYCGVERSQPDLIPEVLPPDVIAEIDRLLALRRGTVAGRRTRAGRSDYTYGPLMRCALCGGRLRALRFARLREAGDPYWLYWACRDGGDSRVLCPDSFAFPQARLDALTARAITEALARLAPEGERPGQGRKDKGKGRKGPKRPTPAPLTLSLAPDKDASESALRAVTEQMERTWRLYAAGTIKDLAWVESETARLEAQKARVLAQRAQDSAPAAGPARLTGPQFDALTARVSAIWQPGMTTEMEPDKHELLMSLGAFLRVSVRPLSLPFAGRGKHPAARTQGGPLTLTLELHALGLAAGDAITVSEPEDLVWAERSARGRNARAGHKPRAKAGESSDAEVPDEK